MADVTQLRFAQLLKSALGLKTADPGRVITPVMAPVFEVKDVYQPENRVRRGERNYSVTQQFTNTNAVNFGGGLFVCQTGKISILKRVTVSMILPTAANQPGTGGFYILAAVANAGAPTQFGLFKDARTIAQGSSPVSASGFVGATFTTNAFPNASMLVGQQLVPNAGTTTATTLIFDNIDAVIVAGTALSFVIQFSSLPAATWTWVATVEGYEYVPDPAELLQPPP